MANPPAGRNARVVALALWGSAAILTGAALAAYLRLLPVGDDLRAALALVLGAVAAVDLLLGFWFFRASSSA